MAELQLPLHLITLLLLFQRLLTTQLLLWLCSAHCLVCHPVAMGMAQVTIYFYFWKVLIRGLEQLTG